MRISKEIADTEPFPRGQWDYDPSLRAWRPKPEVAAEAARVAAIKKRLGEIDAAKIMPMGALLLDGANQAERMKLQSLETELAQLRASLSAADIAAQSDSRVR